VEVQFSFNCACLLEKVDVTCNIFLLFQYSFNTWGKLLDWVGNILNFGSTQFLVVGVARI
jgi:hypothetical protein